MTDALPNGYDRRVCVHSVSPAAIILACTELSLSLLEREYGIRPLIDRLALVRALVRAADPQRLKPW